jgi:4-hydroxybenzoate polyprenyltransferase
VRSVRGLVLACHPLPGVAVTAFAAAYALAVGLGPRRTALLAVAVLVGQLSIGWCNDAVDAGRDLVAGRADKPVATGLVGRRTVRIAAAAALPACVALSFALGLAPGLVHTACVAAAWAYDLGLKALPVSPLPYLVAFGLLPAVATLARPHGGWPPAVVLAAAALLGLGAHFANTVPDATADAATGVRGLPQRIGPRASLVTTAVAVALGAVLLGAGTRRAGPVVAALLVAGAVLSAGAAVVAWSGRGGTQRSAFRVTLAAVALVIAGFVLGA